MLKRQKSSFKYIFTLSLNFDLQIHCTGGSYGQIVNGVCQCVCKQGCDFNHGQCDCKEITCEQVFLFDQDSNLISDVLVQKNVFVFVFGLYLSRIQSKIQFQPCSGGSFRQWINGACKCVCRKGSIHCSLNAKLLLINFILSYLVCRRGCNFVGGRCDCVPPPTSVPECNKVSFTSRNMFDFSISVLHGRVLQASS